MKYYGGTKRRRYRRGGEGFDPSTPQGKESSFMKGKRLQDEAEARRIGDIASSHKKDVVGKLTEHIRQHPESNLTPSSSAPSSRKSSTAGGRTRRRKHRKTRHRR